MGKGEFRTPISIQAFYTQAWNKYEQVKPLKVIPEEPRIKYFDNPQTFTRLQEYDLFFSYTRPYPLFDKRKERENRHYMPDIRENIFRQEEHKPIPPLTSMCYGRPCRLASQYDFPIKAYCKPNEIAALYRKSGAFIPEEDDH